MPRVNGKAKAHTHRHTDRGFAACECQGQLVKQKPKMATSLSSYNLVKNLLIYVRQTQQLFVSNDKDEKRARCAFDGNVISYN